jgi:hypothetical protein
MDRSGKHALGTDRHAETLTHFRYPVARDSRERCIQLNAMNAGFARPSRSVFPFSAVT